MYRFSLASLLLIVYASSAYAQDSEGVRAVRYFNRLAVGGLFGEGDEVMTASITTIHGVTFRRWRLGGGVGIEGYSGYNRWRTVPFFASASFDLFNPDKNKGLFLQMNAGHSLARILQRVEGTVRNNDYGGFMFNSVAGYRLRGNKPTVYIAAGYAFQRLHYSFEGGWWGSTHYKMTEEINRFILQIGFGLN